VGVAAGRGEIGGAILREFRCMAQHRAPHRLTRPADVAAERAPV
jgi:hypothetical protein